MSEEPQPRLFEYLLKLNVILRLLFDLKFIQSDINPEVTSFDMYRSLYGPYFAEIWRDRPLAELEKDIDGLTMHCITLFEEVRNIDALREYENVRRLLTGILGN